MDNLHFTSFYQNIWNNSHVTDTLDRQKVSWQIFCSTISALILEDKEDIVTIKGR